MRSIKNRLAALETRMRVGMPIYSVTTADGQTRNMDVVRLLMQLLDDEAGIDTPHVTAYRYIRGNVKDYAQLVRLVKGEKLAGTDGK